MRTAGARAPVTRLDIDRNPYPPSPRVLEALRAKGIDADRAEARLREAIGRALGFDVAWIALGDSADDLIARAPARAVVPSPDAVTGERIEPARLDAVSRATGGVVAVHDLSLDLEGGAAFDLARSHPNVLAARSLSYALSLDGRRLAIAVARPEILARLAKRAAPIDAIGLAAGEAALGDLAHTRAMLDRVRATRDRTIRALRAFRYDVWPSETSFVLARVGPDARPLHEALREHGVLVSLCGATGFADCLRISIGTDAEMETFFAALTEIVTSRRPSA